MSHSSEREDDRKFEDLRIVYQALLEDIKLYKNQQWLITYYVFGIYLALSSLLLQQSIKINWIFIRSVLIIILLVMVGGVLLLLNYHREIENSRGKKEIIIFQLSPIIANILKPNESGNQKYEITLILMCAILLGGVFVLLLFLLKFSFIFHRSFL